MKHIYEIIVGNELGHTSFLYFSKSIISTNQFHNLVESIKNEVIPELLKNNEFITIFDIMESSLFNHKLISKGFYKINPTSTIFDTSEIFTKENDHIMIENLITFEKRILQ